MMSPFRPEDVPMAANRTTGFKAIREAGEVFQASDGSWWLTSAEAVQFALHHPELFSSAAALSDSVSPVPLIPHRIDPPDHKKYRRILDPMFAPRIINAIEDDLRSQIRELITAFAGKGECDVVADIARPYPTQVFLTFFGMRLSDRDQLITWVETMLEHLTTGVAEGSAEVQEAGAALFAYIQGYIDEKRRQPSDDVLGRILSLEGPEAWSDNEVLGLCFLMTLAGLDTVTGAIGLVMYHLARNRELRQQMAADPSLIGPVIEEVLRIEPPSPWITRMTTAEVEVCGTSIPAGSPVVLVLGTANREEANYENPDELDVARESHAHVSFGAGIHRCLGSHLARREIRFVVEEFHRLIPDYELPPGFEPKVVWPASTLHLASLPLSFPPVKGS